MNDDELIKVRQLAERAVKGMSDGPLKIAAFQTILERLLSNWGSAEQSGHRSVKQSLAPEKNPSTLRGRVLAIKSEGFFKSQPGLAEIKEALGARGWHHPLTTLSGAMQRLVREKELRRERIGTGNREAWKYSNA